MKWETREQAAYGYVTRQSQDLFFVLSGDGRILAANESARSFTGFSEKINEQIARDIGIKGFLMKPIVISQLACMVRSALDGSST
ncbi:PAS domain-containing protein [Desulfotignum phosphitoxidans]|uniref:PAS domain-containing protein n=1 Tax=Desulfotignum phosphitoxidans DSM 13687 TaxID=1286635 RepID=S0FW67_9BACT|nr:PAS domain-containing protein [Desulfotignum phosphitoxidans]EMS78975.1 hypothetical protein Dpo_6c01740 [Desulfotignum phosphitoxidans DSM 13687]